MADRSPTMQHHQITTRSGGMLIGDVHGPKSAPVVLLIHGYPDTRLVWDRVARQLAATRRVARFDVRGAGDSFVPCHTRDYALSHLAADIGDIIQHVSPDTPVHIVGHDWGGIQAWEAAADPALAGRIASLTTISGPCLDHIGHWLRRRAYRTPIAAARQLVDSWYIGALHVPFLPNVAWSTALGSKWTSLIANQEGTPVAPDPQQIETGRRGAALYRANMLPRLLRPHDRTVSVSVQTIVPTRDPYVSQALADTAAPWVAQRQRVTIDAGHWVLLSHPDWLADRIRGFTAQTEAGTPATAASTQSGSDTAAGPVPV